MRPIQAIIASIVAVQLLISGCFYDPDRSQIPEDTGSMPFNPEDIVGDAGCDASGDAACENAQPSGLGVVCYSDSECAAYHANSCVKKTMEASEKGYCTIADCIPQDCARVVGFQCCNCPLQGAACATDDDATLAETSGCTCD